MRLCSARVMEVRRGPANWGLLLHTGQRWSARISTSICKHVSRLKGRGWDVLAMQCTLDMVKDSQTKHVRFASDPVMPSRLSTCG